MKNIKIIVWSTFLVLFFSLKSFAQTPTVKIENGESHIEYLCFDKENPIDSIDFYYKITFTGIPEFQAVLILKNKNGQVIPPYPRPTLSSNPGNTIEGYCRSNLKNILNDYESGVTNSLELILSIEKFRDGTYGQDDWEYDGISGEVIINLYELPTPHFEDETITACGETTQLTAIPGNQSETYLWSVENNLGVFDPNDEPVTNFTAPPRDDPYKIYFKQTNVECSTEISLNATLLGSPKGIILTNSEVCGSGEAEIILNFSQTTRPALPLNISYTDGSNNFSVTMTELVDTITQIVVGNKIFTLLSAEDQNNCIALTEDLTGSAEVKDIRPHPFAFAVDGDEECGNSIELWTLKPSGNETGEWTLFETFKRIQQTEAWVPAKGECEYIEDDEYGLHEKYTFETNEEYKDSIMFRLGWTLSVPFNGQICSATDIVNVKLWEMPKAFAGKDSVIYANEILLYAEKPTVGSGIWNVVSGNISIDEPTNHNSKASGFNNIPAILEWTVTNKTNIVDKDCVSADSVEIVVWKLRTPNAFSPNDDGKNDFFVIPGASTINNSTFIVFDKDGNVVLKQHDYGKDGKFWDGTVNGKPVPDGIYNYVFMGEGIKPVKKFLIIKRK